MKRNSYYHNPCIPLPSLRHHPEGIRMYRWQRRARHTWRKLPSIKRWLLGEASQRLRNASKNKTKTKRAHIYQLRSGAATTRCGEERKLQESYENINNAPEAPPPTQPVMIWDSLTIIHRQRVRERKKDERHSGYQNPAAKLTRSTKGSRVYRRPITWEAYLMLAERRFKTYAYHLHAVARRSRVRLSLTPSGPQRGEYIHTHDGWDGKGMLTSGRTVFKSRILFIYFFFLLQLQNWIADVTYGVSNFSFNKQFRKNSNTRACVSVSPGGLRSLSITFGFHQRTWNCPCWGAET